MNYLWQNSIRSTPLLTLVAKLSHLQISRKTGSIVGGRWRRYVYDSCSNIYENDHPITVSAHNELQRMRAHLSFVAVVC